MSLALEAPFSDTFISEFMRATKVIFGDKAEEDWLDSLKWRLEQMPDVTVFITEIDSRLVGFKAGYATASDRYYSWLGGVDPDFRRQGIAKKLMNQQHEWLYTSRFQLLETHVEQNNKVMVQLNLGSGLAITGFFLKDSKPNFVMQKNVSHRYCSSQHWNA